MGCLHFFPSSQAAILDAPNVLDAVNPPSTLLPPDLPKEPPTVSSSKRKLTDEEQLRRKNMRVNAMVQRSWISSMIVPGLGQIYNKNYWKPPCFYLGFWLIGYLTYQQHKEMNKCKRQKLELLDSGKLPRNTEKRIKECGRTRDLFIMITIAWYLLNIYDAYAMAHDQTVNFTDDIASPLAAPLAAPQTEVAIPASFTPMASLSLPIYF
ncbi:DUF5683 domain-containing protein [Candidatus Cardinium hertigii]|jgi:hypothetical protein|nr:DUF5683 domain-containing protein [Candidatus Cardinium hertigii]